MLRLRSASPMNRQTLALAVRDLAARMAIAKSPKDLFRLSNRLDRLAPVLSAITRDDAIRILDDETNPARMKP